MKKIVSSGKCMNNNKMFYIALIFTVAIILGSVLYVFNPSKMYERFGNSSNISIEYIYMENCGHCVEFNPTWEQVSKMPEFSGVSFKKFDVSTDRAKKFNIGSTPTVLVVKNDMPVATFNEERTVAKLSKFVKNYM